MAPQVRSALIALFLARNWPTGTFLESICRGGGIWKLLSLENLSNIWRAFLGVSLVPSAFDKGLEYIGYAGRGGGAAGGARRVTFAAGSDAPLGVAPIVSD